MEKRGGGGGGCPGGVMKTGVTRRAGGCFKYKIPEICPFNDFTSQPEEE